MKKKFLSLGLAVMLLLGAAGCAFKTPETVGSIGGVEIPAGVYLLAQYNAYGTAASAAELATGETASDVKAVLSAQCTGTIGDEEVTATGKDYVAKVTQRSLEYYAAVESKFAELGGELDETAIAEAAETADSLWENSGDLYTANGIGKESLNTYLLNSQKAAAIAELLYGEDGADPVSEQEYEDFVNNECYYFDLILFPLYDYNYFVFATEEQEAAINELADTCAKELAEVCSADMPSSSAYAYLYTAAAEYLPQAFSTLGVDSFDTSTAAYYIGSQLFTPTTLASYSDGAGGNTLTDAADEAEYGEWIKVDLGTSIAVVRKMDPLGEESVAGLVADYGLLDELKSEEVKAMLYEEGAAMEHALSDSAMNTYAASKIKRTV